MKLAHPTVQDIGRFVVFKTTDHGMRCEILRGLSGEQCVFDSVANEHHVPGQRPARAGSVLFRPHLEDCYVVSAEAARAPSFPVERAALVSLAAVREVIKALRRKASASRGLSKLARVTDAHRMQLLGEIAGYVGAAELVSKLDPSEEP